MALQSKIKIGVEFLRKVLLPAPKAMAMVCLLVE